VDVGHVPDECASGFGGGEVPPAQVASCGIRTGHGRQPPGTCHPFPVRQVRVTADLGAGLNAVRAAQRGRVSNTVRDALADSRHRPPSRLTSCTILTNFARVDHAACRGYEDGDRSLDQAIVQPAADKFCDT
jgi:hypothetical protein